MAEPLQVTVKRLYCVLAILHNSNMCNGLEERKHNKVACLEFEVYTRPRLSVTSRYDKREPSPSIRDVALQPSERTLQTPKTAKLLTTAENDCSILKVIFVLRSSECGKRESVQVVCRNSQ